MLGKVLRAAGVEEPADGPLAPPPPPADFSIDAARGPYEDIAAALTRGASNCDFNDDGRVDFSNPQEGGCANSCQQSIGCSEWSNCPPENAIFLHALFAPVMARPRSSGVVFNGLRIETMVPL
jgi:hypothetical protein